MDNKDENFDINEDEFEIEKEVILLYIQYVCKTANKEILKNVNELSKTWRADVAKLFEMTQKALSAKILELKQTKNEDEILDILMEGFDNYLTEEDDEEEKLEQIPEDAWNEKVSFMPAE